MQRTDELLLAVIGFIRRYCILPSEDAYTALGLFALHTFAFDAANATMYIAALSPDKQSGKTRLLEVMELLVARPWRTTGATTAVIFRKIELEQPTLLMDEVDTIFTKHGEVNETLRGVLNQGNRYGGVIPRCSGDNHEPKDYKVFGPKIMAGINTGGLPDTIRDRAVIIPMQRRLRHEQVERFLHWQVMQEVAPLREALDIWAQANLPVLRNALPELPEELSDRAAEGWAPMLAIADIAGSRWGELARSAAIALSSPSELQEENVGVQALTALREFFRTREQAHTRDILHVLNANDELPFATYNSGRGLTALDFARLVRPFGAKSRSMRVHGRPGTPKGYTATDFEDAFLRYLPPLPSEPATPQHRAGGTVEPVESGVLDAHGRDIAV